MAKHQRDGAKEAFWRGMLKQHSASGLGVRAFCRREKLAESAFYFWRRTIALRDGTRNSPPAFVPAVLGGKPAHDAPLVLKLAQDIQIQLPHSIPAARLAELVRALETRAEP